MDALAVHRHPSSIRPFDLENGPVSKIREPVREFDGARQGHSIRPNKPAWNIDFAAHSKEFWLLGSFASLRRPLCCQSTIFLAQVSEFFLGLPESPDFAAKPE